jgi:hypothetical protein
MRERGVQVCVSVCGGEMGDSKQRDPTVEIEAARDIF